MRRLLLSILAISMGIALVAPAAASGHARRHCRAGYVRRHRHHHWVCVRRKRVAPKAPVPAAPAPKPTVDYRTKVDPSFTQDPANPLSVTYAYNADATATVNGVSTDLAVTDQLPAGILNFYSQATPGGPEQLYCSTNVGGADSAASCPIAYAQTGTYDVTTQYIPNAGSAVTETDVEVISPFASSTEMTVTEGACGTAWPTSGEYSPYCTYEVTTAVSGPSVSKVTMTATSIVPSFETPTTSTGSAPLGSCTYYAGFFNGQLVSPGCGVYLSGNGHAWALSASTPGNAGFAPSSSPSVDIEVDAP